MTRGLQRLGYCLTKVLTVFSTPENMHNCTQFAYSSLWIPPEIPISDSSLLLPMSPLLSWMLFESMHFPPPQTSLKFLYVAQLCGRYNINIHSSVNITSTANKTPQSPLPRTMWLSDLSPSGRPTENVTKTFRLHYLRKNRNKYLL